MRKWLGEESARGALERALAENPVRTAAELAEIGRCSRQRVHQILKSLGMRLPSIADVRRARGIKIEPVPRVKVDGPMAGVSHSTAGTIGEMLAAANLLARGWMVFFPLVRTAKCDLIAMSADGSKLRRIEVRSAKKIKGYTAYNKKPSDVCDHYAIVLPQQPIIFLPEIELG